MKHRLLKGTCTTTFIAAVFTIARLWKQPGQMDQENVVFIQNGILLSLEEE
jgi:hypothetical protein